jgi:hypothetical protein
MRRFENIKRHMAYEDCHEMLLAWCLWLNVMCVVCHLHGDNFLVSSNNTGLYESNSLQKKGKKSLSTHAVSD